MILPSSGKFFFAQETTILKDSGAHTLKDSKPMTCLAAREVFKWMDLNTRQKISLQLGSAHLRHLNDSAPHCFQSLAIGANLIEFDFYGASYTFSGANKLTNRILGGLKKEKEFEGPQESVMKEILNFYLNRRGTTVKKLFLQDQKAFSLLKEIEILKKFEIKSSDGLFMRDFEKEIGQLPDGILRKIEWTLMDKREQ